MPRLAIGWRKLRSKLLQPRIVTDYHNMKSVTRQLPERPKQCLRACLVKPSFEPDVWVAFPGLRGREFEGLARAYRRRAQDQIWCELGPAHRLTHFRRGLEPPWRERPVEII